MTSGILCTNCGKQMMLTEIEVYYDAGQNDRFIDVLYSCPSIDCENIAVARYKDEYFFCNLKRWDDMKEYKVNIDNREVIHCCFHHRWE